MFRWLTVGIILTAILVIGGCSSQRASTGPTRLSEAPPATPQQIAAINPQLAKLIEAHQGIGLPERKPPAPDRRVAKKRKPAQQPQSAAIAPLRLPPPSPKRVEMPKVKQTRVTAVTPVQRPAPAPVAPPTQRTPKISDAAIRTALIKQSRLSYSGSCPCPYNRDRGGRSCGRRSAYSRPGGASPLCFPQDVTATMITEFRSR